MLLNRKISFLNKIDYFVDDNLWIGVENWGKVERDIEGTPGIE